MNWYWIVYWLFFLSTIIFSIIAIIVGRIRKENRLALFGLGYLFLSIIVPIISFFYCIGRDVRTDEFEYLFEGLLSFNFVAYLITSGYVLLAYGLVITPKKIQSISTKRWR